MLGDVLLGDVLSRIRFEGDLLYQCQPRKVTHIYETMDGLAQPNPIRYKSANKLERCLTQPIEFFDGFKEAP